MEEISSASKKSTRSAASSASSASKSSSTTTAVQKHGVDPGFTAKTFENAAAVLKEESFFSKNRNFIIFIGLVALFVAVSVLSSKIKPPAATTNVVEPPNTFAYTELVRTLYIPGSDAIGIPDDFRNTEVTGKIHDYQQTSFENQVSVVVAHSLDELNQPGVQSVMASESTRPVVLLMNTPDNDVPPHANYTVRKNGNVFMYIPSTSS